MNKLLSEVIESRKGHYCHCVEVDSVYELESVAEGIIQDFEHKYDEAVIIEFLSSLQVYYLGDCEETENAVYDFSFNEYCKDTIYSDLVTDYNRSV
jgi:hypothetical protein